MRHFLQEAVCNEITWHFPVTIPAYIPGLTIQYKNKKLWWVNKRGGQDYHIMHSDLDGKNIQVLKLENITS